YQRIFDRLGLRYTTVAALSGAMGWAGEVGGGSRSEEFLAEAVRSRPRRPASRPPGRRTADV
ncbi:MAG: hypothetical protein ACRDT2_20800, partial [Natronosporangium sp.]